MENALVVHNSDCGHLVTKVVLHFLPRSFMGLLGLSILCSGCSVRRVTYNETITTDQIQFIQTGHTTMLDVVNKLGAPDEITESDTGVVALYKWIDAKSAAIDFAKVAGRFIPFSPPLTLGRTDISPEQLQVVFDPQWTVRAYGFSRRTTDEPVVWFWPF